MKINLKLILVMAGLISPAALGALTIDVTRSTERGIAIAVVDFAAAEPKDSELISQVIRANLERSGKFELLPRTSFLETPNTLEEIQYKNWRLIKAEVLVIGQVVILEDGRRDVSLRLLDVFREKQLSGQKFVVAPKQLRRVAHQISDLIYQKMLGKRGVFDTRLVYVEARGEDPRREYFLRVADADGQNIKTILESSQPILSPAWSPDGLRIAYVSFERKHTTIVYVQDLFSGERMRIAEYKGLNSAPAWSPDGSKIALTLSKNGNPEIYIYTLATKNLLRITKHTAIDTEPAWSPDGNTIAFTSSRAGSPQIYSVSASGGNPTRLTRNGSYNAGANYSADGKSIALVTNQGNGYRIGLYSFKSKMVRELTKTTQDESPSFAPNGEIILYATQKGGRNVLMTVSPDGTVAHTLDSGSGLVWAPAWSPYNRRL